MELNVTPQRVQVRLDRQSPLLKAAWFAESPVAMLTPRPAWSPDLHWRVAPECLYRAPLQSEAPGSRLARAAGKEPPMRPRGGMAM